MLRKRKENDNVKIKQLSTAVTGEGKNISGVYGKRLNGGEMAITLSVCMIVKDEELVLERCLRSVSKFADEIIVVDTGSTDSSMEIIRKYTTDLYQYSWRDDFADARNESYSHASCDYIMWMDADDDIEPADIEKLLELKETMTSDIDVVFLTYDTDHDDVSCGCVLLRDRIIRRDLNVRWTYPVHEGIPIMDSFKILYREDIIIYHRKLRENEKRRNIGIFEKAMEKGFRMNDYNQAYYCRELTVDEKYENAVALYQQMKKEGAAYENIHYARFFYVESMKKLKRYEELEQILLEETRVWPADENLSCFLGDAFLWNGKEEEAEKCFLKAMNTTVNLRDLCMHDKMCQEFLPCVRLANINARRGEAEKALQYFKRAREICPRNPMVLRNMAYFEKLEKKVRS